ncbi:cache domain-containing sensor histidine kinase [Gorillibacterium timonense]|uniref:cache domain-containing sensor histidine kinase n=1 Tax=Gorillibacterium timonense TaxID=1689269 RepID=UPI00071E520F|nr:sensor histidine kinase [Gorillibacterium timonense]
MRMTLRAKLFTAFFTLILLPLFLFGIAAYSFLSDILQEKYTRQAEITLRALYQSVDFIFQEMNKVTDSTIASNAIQEVLRKPGANVTDIDYLKLNEVQRNFRDLLVNHPSVSYAFVYTMEGGTIIPFYQKDRFVALPFDVFKKETLYSEVLARDGKPKWVGPFEYPQLTGTDPVFTQVRVVKDIITLSDKGVLVVQMKNSALEDLFRYFTYKQETYQTRFFIVNRTGLILFDSSFQSEGLFLREYTKDLPEVKTGTQSKRQMFQDVDSIVSSIRLDNEGWQLVSVTPWSSLSKEINLYTKWVGLIIVACLLSAFVFLLFFVNRITRTISRISRTMRRVEDGELDVRVRESGSDELNLLARSLNSMIARIQELLGSVKKEQEQKTQAEMRVLEAQIKPHFLFNTLESINVLAVQNEGRKVSQMVLRLASILRISIHGNSIIPLRQEIEHLRSYLEIQRFRFEDLFDYEIEVPEELLDCPVQKLTLQPLVENCIQHGFDGLARKGLIRVTAERAGGRLVLTVEDNGIGMTPGQLAAFHYLDSEERAAGSAGARGTPEESGRRASEAGLTLTGAEQSPNGAGWPARRNGREGGAAGSAGNEPERRGLGLRSVADRIRIQFGSRYGLFICSEAGVGTVIKCVLPLAEPGDPNEIESHAG